MTYALMRETFFIEDIRRQLLLPSTRAYETTLQGLQEKRKDIRSEFYTTEAMCTREWTRPNYEMRHLRYAIHGFHHKLKYHLVPVIVEHDVFCRCVSKLGGRCVDVVAVCSADRCCRTAAFIEESAQLRRSDRTDGRTAGRNIGFSSYYCSSLQKCSCCN
ncbi:hypothetical protein ANN_14512 [Periplaneta americana]|uniref:Uncharacterized protein n=1 Tax=Periplaneta americana TaxID=6978 RepID=A0ABQ8SWJ0_PERAM|nr:hypothetical protein ANN_14512 [Periplaneta americana]